MAPVVGSAKTFWCRFVGKCRQQPPRCDTVVVGMTGRSAHIRLRAHVLACGRPQETPLTWFQSKPVPCGRQGLSALSVFPNPDGGIKGKSTVIDAWKSMKKRAGLPAEFRFHGLRHDFASWLVSNGTDLATVQTLMTHKNASTTARYAHLMPGALKDAATKSGKRFSAGAKKDGAGNVIELKKRVPYSGEWKNPVDPIHPL